MNASKFLSETAKLAALLGAIAIVVWSMPERKGYTDATADIGPSSLTAQTSRNSD